MLNETKLLREQRGPRSVTLVIRSLGKCFVELHVVVNIASWDCTLLVVYLVDKRIVTHV